MPAGGRRAPLLVDTSVAVALVVADHAHHEPTSAAVRGRRLGLSGHAAFESYSALTRLPAPARRSPAAIARLLRAGFPETRFLGSGAAAVLHEQLSVLGIAGGSVYDALIAAAAAEHGLTLMTRDRRALETYRVLGADAELLP